MFHLHFKTPGITVVYHKYATPTSKKPIFWIALLAFEPESLYNKPINVAHRMCKSNFKWVVV